MATRDAVIKRAVAAIQQSTRRGGTTAVIHGPPGSGKTTALAQISDRATGAGTRVVAAAGRWADREVPYGALRDILRQATADTRVPESVSHVLGVLGLGRVVDGVVDPAGVCHATTVAVDALRSRGPVAIVVDDIHWADEPSLFVLTHVARRVTELRCCLVVSVAMPIGFESPATPLLAAAQHTFELPAARTASDREITDRLLRRMMETSAVGRRVAHALAVLDGHADPSLIAAATATDAEKVTAGLAELRVAALLDAPCALARPLVSTLRHDRSPELIQVTTRAAEALARRGDVDVAAGLLLPLPPVDEPWAAAALVSAAERAAAANEHTSAVVLYRRALREPWSQAGRVHVSLAASLSQVGATAEALEALDSAGELQAGLSAAACSLASVATHHGDVITASSALARAAAWCVDEEDRILTAATLKAISALAPVDTPRMASIDLRQLGGRTLAERFALAIEAFHTAQAGRPLTEAADLAVRAAADGRLVQESAGDGAPAYFAIDVLLDAEEFDLAASMLDTLMASTQGTGAITAFHRHSGFRAYARMLMGDVRGAEPDARLALTGDLSAIDEALAVGALVEALVERGELDEAQVVAAFHLERLGTATTSAMLVYAAARLAHAQSDHDTVLELCRRLDEAEREQARRGVPLLWRSVAAVDTAARGDRAGGARLADEEIAIARRTGHRRGLITGLLSKAAVVPSAERAKVLDAAMTESQGTRSRLLQARVRAAYGSDLRRRNRSTDARLPLREAIALATGCGATALAERARDELRVAGGKPRRLETSGPGALTPMERRVASEARAGLTNGDIAATLFISRKTVEMHLSNAYRKLGITSRTQLRDHDLGVPT